MVAIWKDLQEVWGDPFSDIIQEGIDKLDTYHDRVELVPAYVISMSKLFLSHMNILLIYGVHSSQSIDETQAHSSRKTR